MTKYEAEYQVWPSKSPNAEPAVIKEMFEATDSRGVVAQIRARWKGNHVEIGVVSEVEPGTI